MRTIHRSILFTTAFAAMLIPASWAQTQPATGADDDDGPGRAVARLSVMNGDVNVRRGDSGDVVAGAINAPLMVEDRVSTAPGGRAEVQLNYYNRLRLGSDTEVRFSELDWHKFQMQIPRGAVSFSALPGSNDQIELSTPSASLRPLAAGSYRVTVYDDGMAEFTVRRGEAEIYTPRGTRRLATGQTMRVRTAGDGSPEFQLTGEIARDGLDDFSDHRDREITRVKSYQYMSRDIDGGEDLDSSGRWDYVAPYGYCWRPYVVAGWAPYRYGRWVWQDYYGWTWLSYDSWGWAPYHYGRWFWGGGGWYWYPGPVAMRTYWRPALVAFFGYGSVHVGVGFGHYGWVPLAPHERFRPWYGRGDGRINYNTVNINVTNVYRNARVEGGVTGLRAEDFHRGGVGRGMQTTSRELAQAGQLHGALPIAPTHDSLRFSDRNASPRMGNNRMGAPADQGFVARQHAPTGQRTSFEQQRQNFAPQQRADGFDAGLRQNGQGWRRATDDPKPNPAGNAGGNRNPGDDNGGRRGWTTFGAPANGAHNSFAENGQTPHTQVMPNSGDNNRNADAPTRHTGGWGNFGQPSRTGVNENPNRGGWSTGAPVNRPAEANPSGNAPSNGNTDGRNWNTGGRGTEGRNVNPGNGTSGRGTEGRNWSTGGGTSERNTDERRMSTGGGDRPNSSGRGWFGGGGNDRGNSRSGADAPRYSAPTGSSHSQPSAPPRMAPPSGGGGGGSHAPAPSGGGGGGRAPSGSSPSGGGGGGGRRSR